MLIDPAIERVLQKNILPDLLSGRRAFDIDHTLAVVHWMKNLIDNSDLNNIDSQALITAAYAHDWGYVGLFNNVDSNNLNEIMKRKPLHMQKGAEKIENLINLKLETFFSIDQKKLVVHLVKFHDRVEDLKTDEEILLMESDTLGMIDTDLVTPSFNKSDHQKHLQNELLGRRIPHFRHSYAKQQVEICLKKLIKFYENKN